MLLSIVIPTYSRVAATRDAISSVISQKVADRCEIIVVDDASEIPFEWRSDQTGDFELSIIRHPVNRGPASARNTGVLAARGRLITFLDSDDQLMPDTLGKRLDHAAAQNLEQSTGKHKILACGWQEIGPAGPAAKRIPKAGSSDDLLRGCWFAPGSCILANTDFLRSAQGPFETRLRRLEDYDLFARLGIAGAELAVMPITGALIRKGAKRSDKEITEAIRFIRERVMRMREQKLVNDGQMRSVLAYLAYEDARRKLVAGHMLSGTMALAASFRYAPRARLYPGPGWDVVRD